MTPACPSPSPQHTPPPSVGLPYLFRRPLILLVTAYLLALLVWRGWESHPDLAPNDPSRYADGRSAVLRGTVAGAAEFQGDRFRFVLRAREWKRAALDVSIPVHGRIMVSVLDPTFAAGWGDAVELRGDFFVPSCSTVPGGFDYRRFLAEKNVHSQMSVYPSGWTVLSRVPPWSPYRWVNAVRARFLSAFDRHLSPHASALLSGLVLGKKPAKFAAMDRDFRRSGTYHLLVASGSNVGFVIALWYFFGRWCLFLPRRAVWVLSIPCAFLYAGLACADQPVMRAALMSALGIVGYLLSRFDRVEHAVAFSAGLLLLFQPRALFEAGFQMSYAATLGVVMAVPALESAIFAFFSDTLPKRVDSVLRWVVRLILVSLSAQFALLPLLIHYFQRLSVVGLVSNMAAVPWAAVCLLAGVVLAIVDMVFPAGGSVVHVVAGLTEKSVVGLWSGVHFFARLPAAEQIIVCSRTQILILSGLVAGTLILLAGREKKWKWILSLWLVGFPVQMMAGSTRHSDKFSLSWLDVGLGDALVAMSPSGQVTVIDAGPAQAGRYQLVPFLRARGVHQIDRIILTQGDPAHSGGLRPLLEEFPVKEFLCSEFTWKDRVWSAERELIEQRGIAHRFLSADSRWEEGGVLWKVLNPSGRMMFKPRGGKALRDNVPRDNVSDERSLVIYIRHGNQSALLTSDLPPGRQMEIAARLDLPLSVIQFPHHGRVFPDIDFLALPRAQWIVLSGDRLSGFVRSLSMGAPVWSTERDGSIEWLSDGGHSSLKRLRPPRVDVYELSPVRN